MAKAKKTTKKVVKASRKTVRPAKKSVVHQKVDNKLSMLVLVAAILVFVLAALSLSR